MGDVRNEYESRNLRGDELFAPPLSPRNGSSCLPNVPAHFRIFQGVCHAALPILLAANKANMISYDDMTIYGISAGCQGAALLLRLANRWPKCLGSPPLVGRMCLIAPAMHGVEFDKTAKAAQKSWDSFACGIL